MGINRIRPDWDGKVPTLTHDQLVKQAFSYLKMVDGCKVMFKERKASTREEPDAIGFSGSFSTLIECKASVSDFLADKQKCFRAKPEDGMGYNRYYMAPVGLLSPNQMPQGWGLLEVYEKESRHPSYRKIVKTVDSDRFIERNQSAEVSYLVSAIRRIQTSMVVFVEKESE